MRDDGSREEDPLDLDEDPGNLGDGGVDPSLLRPCGACPWSNELGRHSGIVGGQLDANRGVCAKCEGRGFVTTEFGEEILSLVKTFLLRPGHAGRDLAG